MSTVIRRPDGGTVKLNQGGDNQQTANARVQLKLAALAHHGSRAGRPSLAQAGSDLLAEIALDYVATLAPDLARVARERRGRFTTEAHQRARDKLELASIAYSSTRVGADADINFSRAGLGVLCQASIGYAEALAEKTEGSTRTKDPTLALDSGT